MRARLALASSGLAYELREVALRSKPAELLAASAKGTVPVLVLPDGKVIDESLDVMQWALRQHDPDGWLAGDLGSMLALIAGNDGLFKQHLDRYKYPNRFQVEHRDRHAGDPRLFSELHRAAGADWLVSLEDRLCDRPGDGRWLFGDRASLADMAVLPFVRQFAHTDASWFAAQPWPRLAAWLAGFEASALYQGVMEKKPLWQPA
jgi:glutathione S-transferase